MKCGHLFNGIGGFALAASWMGWDNIMHCEIDPFCNRVMNYHFPNSFQHEDIRTTDFRIWRGRIDLLTGGFPCQPWSDAGKRKGTADDRHLWPEMLRAIREIQPRWIVPENVRGFVNWNDGLVFDQVQAEMEAAGYEVIPFLLPAAGVGAPHKRDRIWIVAHAADYPRHHETGNEGQKSCALSEKRSDELILAANTCIQGLQGCQNNGGTGSSRQERSEQLAGLFPPTWEDFPTQSPVRSGNDGIPDGLVDITVSKWAEESLTSLGNAIVPAVAYEIFKAIDQYELL